MSRALAPLAAVVGLVSVFTGLGCASQVVNGFLRGRPLGVGHMETGVSLSWARQPADGVPFRREEVKPENPESLSLVPAPVGHFRLGVSERVDIGLDVAISGAAVSAKYAIFDSDQLMVGVVGRLSTWTADLAGQEEQGYRAQGPIGAALAIPVATRPLEWFELAVTPNIGMLRVNASRTEVQGLVERDFTTVHAGMAFGASFAAWRFRINPEVNVVAVLRPDQGDGKGGFLAAYPGVAAFLAY